MAIRKTSPATCHLLKAFCLFVLANFAGSAPVEAGVGFSSGCARDPCKMIAGVCGGKLCINTANCGFRCGDGGAGSTNAAVIREKHFQVNPVESLDVSLFGADSLSADDHHETPTTATTTTPRIAKADSHQTTLSVNGSTSVPPPSGRLWHRDNVVTTTPSGGRNSELSGTTSFLPPASGAPVSTIGTDSSEVVLPQQEHPGLSTLGVLFKDVGLALTTSSPTENLRVSTDISNNVNTTHAPSASGDVSQSASLSSGTKLAAESSNTMAKPVTPRQVADATPPSTTKASVNGVSARLGDDVRERNATVITDVPRGAPRDVSQVQAQTGAAEAPVLPTSSASGSNITGKEMGLADITSRLIDIIGKIQELYGRSNESAASKGSAARESPSDSKAQHGTSGAGASAGEVTSADKLSVGSVTAPPAATTSATNSSIKTETTTEATTEASFPSLMDTFQTLTKGSSNGALTRIVSRVHYVDEGFGMVAP
ncbi:hypothetical protein C0Q70_16260 [Pomacea canaliculata]|uniref:WAP domain-containing protein n=1 Tax=Pomacea canaliculata TaxID=400727 RepID=A0A2T7NP99_POMCA|nr:endochitinase A1-like [Pomacea canaliculata]XP_025111040.1 endochitinase A1-like [Pomacea canaliculata]XP_025111041.1 endochitinase A1-like [Pomacea canaliculata]XP_025111042.1 endochitinase A1-like [Pomacea canaliculata]PVD22999.1 hypothetical protein C0Q70_16260 [Pomacea canaliculata]